MKQMPHPVVAAAGLSFLCCLGWAGPLLNPTHDWIYHDGGAAAAVFLPILVNVALLWVLFALLLWLTGKTERTRIGVWSGVLSFLPWLLLKDVILLLGVTLPHRLSLVIFLGSGVCWIVVMVLWRASFLPVFSPMQHFCGSMLAFAGVCGFLVAGQLAWYCWNARGLQSPATLHVSAAQDVRAGQRARPRVIWIILDELSYQQVYERRFPSLELPAFDRLASEGTVFTQVTPAANSTELAVPSLMTGLPVDHIRAGSDGMLQQLHDPTTGHWTPFHAQDSVFQDALNHGFRTAAAGWYNPYCRILAGVLDQCRWVYRQEYVGGMFSDASARTNLVAPWMAILDKIGVRRSDSNASGESEASAHIADYEDLVAASDQVLRDSSVDFLLLHIPVPHPGGIYNRRTRSFTTHRASYIDNLALADAYLAHVRLVLEQRGEWNSSAVVVMGDHSWRTTLLWVASPEWTAEDEAASDGGRFDQRPGYIVKLPHQETSARIDVPFAAVRTRALLAGIVDGSIRSEVELARFAGKGERTDVESIRAGDGGLRNRGR